MATDMKLMALMNNEERMALAARLRDVLMAEVPPDHGALALIVVAPGGEADKTPAVCVLNGNSLLLIDAMKETTMAIINRLVDNTMDRIVAEAAKHTDMKGGG